MLTSVIVGVGARDADGANKQAHAVLLLGEDVLDAGPHRRSARRWRGPWPRGIGLPLGFLRWMRLTLPALLQIRLVGRRTIRGVGPYIRGCVCRIDQALAQPGAVMSRCIGRLAATDDPITPVDRDVALVAEDRDGDVDLRLAVRFGLAFENFTVQRASRSFWRSLAGLSFQSCGISPALMAAFSPSVLRCLGAATSVASTIWPAIGRYPASLIAWSSRPNSLSRTLACDQRLAEVPQRIGVRYRVAGAKSAEPHPAQPVADQIIRLLQRQPVQRLQAPTS